MPLRTPARLTSGAAVAAVAVLLAGCSAASSGPAADEADITMQSSWINDAEFSGYFAAMDEGLYEAEGISFEYLSGGPSVIPESSLLSGAADVALTTPDTTINAIVDQGADFVIIGTQYQRNPLGVVSLASSGIDEPADLVGKTIAVPDVNRLAFDAMLTINDVDPASVTVVPYAYDPTPLLQGEVDATIDFVTNVPYTIEQAGEEPSSFLLYDVGYKIPNDTVVVTRDTLENKREELLAWLRASRGGWEKVLEDPAAYPPKFADTWFRGTGRTVENETYFNTAQKPLIESESGIFALTDQQVQDTIDTLALIGIQADKDMFDLSLLDEL
ncbi:ABC transporter substrate-binding protein [Georgenia ruanii]|nr:ABC transporter substrate-binding protein [Georgenia ruanii]